MEKGIIEFLRSPSSALKRLVELLTACVMEEPAGWRWREGESMGMGGECDRRRVTRQKLIASCIFMCVDE